MPPFPDTHRSVFDRIRSGDVEVRCAAFGALADGYWRPSYHYLRLRWHLSADDAEDVVQGFFTAAFEKRYVEKFDPAKARFRTFLRVCLDRFVQNDRETQQAEKRGGAFARLSIDVPGAERELAAHLRAPVRDPDAFFRDETIRALFSRTIDAMRAEAIKTGRTRAFDVFERHDLQDGLQDGESSSYADLASSLSLTVSQVTNDLHQARRRFRELALEALRDLVATDEEYRAEARDLFGFEVAPLASLEGNE